MQSVSYARDDPVKHSTGRGKFPVHLYTNHNKTLFAKTAPPEYIDDQIVSAMNLRVKALDDTNNMAYSAY